MLAADATRISLALVWATSISVVSAGAEIHCAGEWLLVAKKWQAGDIVELSFGAEAQPVPANNGEFYVRRGPLFYALPISAIKRSVKDYPLPAFHDYLMFPAVWAHGHYALGKTTGTPSAPEFQLVQDPKSDSKFPWDATPIRLQASVLNLGTNKTETVTLVPMGSGEAILRRMTFPIAP